MEHSFAFDPTYGYALDGLDGLRTVAGPPAPADFADFWRATYDEAVRVPVRPTLREVGELAGKRVYEVEFDAWGAVRLGGWLTLPPDGAPMRGVVVGHGYGGREAPVADVPGPDAVTVFPCARGFHRSARPDLPNNSAAHVIHGIGSRGGWITWAGALAAGSGRWRWRGTGGFGRPRCACRASATTRCA